MIEGGDRGLSVVIPAYNEARRIGATLEQVTAWLAARGGDSEVVVVDDGSRDATPLVVEQVAARSKVKVRLVRSAHNRGKGASVRLGVEAAAQPVVLFSDADLSTPIEEAAELLARLAAGNAIAIGSRAAAGARIEVRQAWYRELMGKTFNLLVRALIGIRFRDTQCGFKAFEREAARRIFRAGRVTGFGFDVEVLFLARRFGYRVAEVPVVWRNSPHSRVNPVTDSARMALDLLLIRWRAWTGAYDAPAAVPPDGRMELPPPPR
jgi:glycosyltransferase involved in cell wall biosynthesis